MTYVNVYLEKPIEDNGKWVGSVSFFFEELESAKKKLNELKKVKGLINPRLSKNPRQMLHLYCKVVTPTSKEFISPTKLDVGNYYF